MSTPVAPALQTVAFIRSLVRELTGSPGEQQLTTQYIDSTLNEIYSTDFPYSIKIDQMRDVYTFYTTPYQGYYPLDVNYNQGVRSPVYIDGIQATFYKDREDFYRIWPRWPTFFNSYNQSSPTGGVTNVVQSSPGVVTVTAPAYGIPSGSSVYFANIGGITNINGNSYVITVVDANNFTISFTISGAYTSGGTWWQIPIQFNFTVPGPFLHKELSIGGTYINGTSFSISDDGQGTLQLLVPNPQVSVPPQNTNPAIPGMYNRNTENPGLLNPTNIGTVDYVSGVFSFNLSLPLAQGTNLQVRVSQYEPGRPYSILFWNNFFIVRPIPKHIHRIEVETYLTPVRFLQSTDMPILNQWAKCLGYYVAAEILLRRQDMAGYQNVMIGLEKQKALVLERQATEEINQRNKNVFSESTPSSQWGNGIYGGWGY